MYTYILLPCVLRLQRKKNLVLQLILHSDTCRWISNSAALTSLLRHSMIDAVYERERRKENNEKQHLIRSIMGLFNITFFFIIHVFRQTSLSTFFPEQRWLLWYIRLFLESILICKSCWLIDSTCLNQPCWHLWLRCFFLRNFPQSHLFKIKLNTNNYMIVFEWNIVFASTPVRWTDISVKLYVFLFDDVQCSGLIRQIHLFRVIYRQNRYVLIRK